MFLIRTLALISVVLSSNAAFAFPMPAPGQVPWTGAPSYNKDAAVDFTAIVALSNCSGSLVRFESSLGTDHALILTNGHCLGGGFLKPGEVRVNAAVSRTFNLLNSNATGVLGVLNATRVVYATMTGTDMTIYELRETYDQIESKYRTRALTFSARRPTEGTKIAVASGYWRRMYSCSIDKFIYQMREDKWTFVDSMRYTEPGCDTIGGTSGSPVIDQQTNQVVGVNNTGNEDGARCTMNNPCEVSEQGAVTVVKGASYAQQTYWLTTCLGAGNQLDLNRPGCMLPKPRFH